MKLFVLVRMIQVLGLLPVLWLGQAMADLSLPQLPADLPLNEEAGRGGWWMVTLRLESGAEVPVIVDSGSTGSILDKTLESKLGSALGKTVSQSWGVKQTNNMYAAPKFYLGGVRLAAGDPIATVDLQISDRAGHAVLGILGYDVLQHYCIQLDFTGGMMRFLNDEQAVTNNWGKAFPIVALNAGDGRPAVAANLFGENGPHSLIDSGYPSDGWLMAKHYQSWTNTAAPRATGEARSPTGIFDGDKYPLVSLDRNDVESDGIGLRFLARHLVTLDFPKQTLYLKRQSIGPLPDPGMNATLLPALDALINELILQDTNAAEGQELRIEESHDTKFEKTVARKLTGTLENIPKPSPAEVARDVSRFPLGDARPEFAVVGWLTPSANRIPLNAEVPSPLLDSGKIYATGLFAHSPSRYVYNLAGKWKRLEGEAGLHTSFQPYAYGVVFVIKTDGKEVLRSSEIQGTQQVSYDINVNGVKTLELIVEKAESHNGGNWALWLEPTLVR
jgi:hypothetical protein